MSNKYNNKQENNMKSIKINYEKRELIPIKENVEKFNHDTDDINWLHNNYILSWKCCSEMFEGSQQQLFSKIEELSKATDDLGLNLYRNIHFHKP